jgi:hypothetical protein
MRVTMVGVAVVTLAGCGRIAFEPLRDAGDAAAVDADLGPAFLHHAYVKASNPSPNDWFGYSVALSGDGATLVVGAINEDSAAAGVDGNQLDNTAGNSGAAYVFVRVGDAWTQQAYLKASNTDPADAFGAGVALSFDGSVLLVGAPDEDSAATGVDGNQLDNTVTDSGAVYVFERTGSAWAQTAYVKASNTGGNDGFGTYLAISGSGDRFAVGAPDEDSAATGIDGDSFNNARAASGAVYLFDRAGGTWANAAYVKASNTGAGDGFSVVALAADGSTLAVGAWMEDSAATGVNGDQANDSLMDAGATYVFSNLGGAWNQVAYLKASNAGSRDKLGTGTSLSADGGVLVVGALDQDTTAGVSGASYVFGTEAALWGERAFLKAANPRMGDLFGADSALSGDARVVVAGAVGEDGGTVGLDGDQDDMSAADSGACYVFVRDGTTWVQRRYVKATNTGAGDSFGFRVAVAGDGATFACSARYEDSNAAGIDGDPSNNSATDSGAVYIYY